MQRKLIRRKTMASAEYHIMEEEMEKRKQIGGSHYNNKAIQPIDYILQNNLGYCEANTVKYVTRHKEKNGAEDIKKAIHYLQFLLANDYGEKI
jgi:hypothetical protein